MKENLLARGPDKVFSAVDAIDCAILEFACAWIKVGTGLILSFDSLPCALERGKRIRWVLNTCS